MGKPRYTDLYHAIAELDIEPDEKCMMFVLSTFATPKGENIRPGEQLLARLMKRSIRQTRRVKRSLILQGLIQKVGKEEYTDVYRFALPGLTFDTPAPAAAAEPSRPALNAEYEAYFNTPAEEAPAAYTEQEIMDFLKRLKAEQQTGLRKHLFCKAGVEFGFTKEDMETVWLQPYAAFGLAPIAKEQPILQ